MTLSVIIVNYNGQKYLANCINSIKEHCKDLAYEILIWDNDSTDNSIDIIETHFSQDVNLFKSKKNLGFAAGNNAAAKHAKGEYLFLLNNDTILLDSIKSIIDLLDLDKTIGLVGAKMLNGHKEYVISCGDLPKPHQLIYFKTFSQIGGSFKDGNFQDNDVIIDVGWLSGSFLITPKFLWDEIGGLDETFFMYVEDVDYSKEVEKKGYRRVFHSGIEYIHFVGFNKTRNTLLVKGYHIYANKHFKGINRIIANFCLRFNTSVKRIKKNYN